jgi:tetratricopeptide (TPR) repeat protein
MLAEGVDIVTLTTTAEGKTKDEAVTNALRSAIEMAFGAFISSKAEIVNDELIRDDIVSVSNGNVKKYYIVSSSTLPSGSIAVSVQAQVSVSKLTSFCKNEGIEVEFAGGLFAANIKLQELYAENEKKAIDNLSLPFSKLANYSFDYKISASDPVIQGDSNSIPDDRVPLKAGMWGVPLTITVAANQNFFTAIDMLYNTLSSLSMTEEEVKNYKKLNKKVEAIIMVISSKKYDIFYLRADQSISKISTLLRSFDKILFEGEVNTGNQRFTIGSLSYTAYYEKAYKLRYICGSAYTTKFEFLRNRIFQKRNELGLNSDHEFVISTIDIEKNRYDVLEYYALHANLTTDDISKIQKYTIKPKGEEITQADSRDALGKAMKLYKDKKYTEAISALKKHIEQDNIDDFAYRLLGDCYQFLGNDSEAIKAYRQAAKLGDRTAEAILVRYGIENQIKFNN